MTLNTTVVTSAFVLQVSDRRMSWEGRPTSDRANKAVVLACEDGVLAITFTGIGLYHKQRTDLWIADRLLETGAPELLCGEVPEIVRDAATDWFRTIDLPGKLKHHTFIFAGWEQRGTRRTPFVRQVTNCQGATPTTMTADAKDQFESLPVHHSKTGAVFFTGLVGSVPRPARRRLSRSLDKATSLDEVERHVVHAIQDAATNPTWSWGIGKDCMSIAVAPDGTVRSRFFSPNQAPTEYGPAFVWNSGCNNNLVADIETLPIPGVYTFGEAQLIVGDTRHRLPLIDVSGDGFVSKVKMLMKRTEAIHKKVPPGDTTLVGIRSFQTLPSSGDTSTSI